MLQSTNTCWFNFLCKTFDSYAILIISKFDTTIYVLTVLLYYATLCYECKHNSNNIQQLTSKRTKMSSRVVKEHLQCAADGHMP